jgi:hypothetical protein
MVKLVKTSYFNFYLVIGILAVAIIVGTLVGSSYNREFFGDDKKLVYLYMENCSACKGFNSTWTEIETKVRLNKDLYKFSVEKHDLLESETGKKYANDFNITYAPAILFLSSSKLMGTYPADEQRTTDGIIKWACKTNSMGK